MEIPLKKITGDYLIEIQGIQEVDGERSEVNVLTEGKYFATSDGERCISYTEYDPENPNKFHNSVIGINPKDNVITIVREGENVSKLVLEKGIKHHCYYNTPYGGLMIGLYTRAIDSSLDDEGGKLFLSYTLDFNAGLISSNECTIKVKRKGA